MGVKVTFEFSTKMN